MKKNKYILGILALIFAMASLYSCKDDAPIYEAAEKLGNDQVYFPSTNSLSIKASSLANSYDVPIARVKTDNAVTVSLTLSGGDGLYSIPASVTFNSGQAVTTFKLSYDPEVVGYDNFSDVVISIGEAYKTPYGITDYAFNIGIPAPWKSLGMATFIEDFITTFFGVANDPYKVEIQENELQPGLFRLVNPFGEAYKYNETGDWDDSRDWYLEINAADPSGVYMNVQQTGMDWGYGMISVGSMAGHNMSKGQTLEEQKAAGYTGNFENGLITFPAKTLLVSMADYQDGGLFKANNKGAFMVLMPGAVLADYSVDVTYLGRFIDTEDKNFVVADIALGEDVEIAKVALVEGKDINSAKAGILDGSINSIEVEASGSVMLPCDVDGEYSVVAISFAGEDDKDVGYDTFEFSITSSSVVNPAATVTRNIINQIKKSSIKTSIMSIK